MDIENTPLNPIDIVEDVIYAKKWSFSRADDYELVADIQTWKDPVPPQRFIDKVTQQYARMTVHNTVKEMGFRVEEEWEMDDNSIELTVTRWQS